jgi:hypothetical protein
MNVPFLADFASDREPVWRLPSIVIKITVEIIIIEKYFL